MLKTFLDICYKTKGVPYDTPSDVFLKTAKDISEPCIAYIYALTEWNWVKNLGYRKNPSKKIIKQQNHAERIEDIYKIVVRKNFWPDNLEDSRYLEYTEHLTPRSFPREIVLGWIFLFWENGWNILEYLYITLLYTEEFFMEEDVLKAIPLAEKELLLENHQIQQDWEELKQGRITKETLEAKAC